MMWTQYAWRITDGLKVNNDMFTRRTTQSKVGKGVLCNKDQQDALLFLNLFQ